MKHSIESLKSFFNSSNLLSTFAIFTLFSKLRSILIIPPFPLLYLSYLILKEFTIFTILTNSRLTLENLSFLISLSWLVPLSLIHYLPQTFTSNSITPTSNKSLFPFPLSTQYFTVFFVLNIHWVQEFIYIILCIAPSELLQTPFAIALIYSWFPTLISCVLCKYF